jgi:hypothetical protein
MVKRIVKKRVVTAVELATLTTRDDSEGITYNDIEQLFSSQDLAEYNALCKRFVDLVEGKNNIEQWDVIFHPVLGPVLVSTLNRIEELRGKYFLPGTFHSVWRAKPLGSDRFEYDEISW